MLKKTLLTVVVIIAVLYVLLLTVPIDPIERQPGTALNGTPASAEDTDWSHLTPRQQVHIQTATWYGIPHSVTTISFDIAALELYLPRLGQAYATGDLEPLEGLAAQKEIAAIAKRINDLAEQGRVLEPTFRQVTIEEAARADGFLAKPFHEDLLYEIVDRVLAQSRERS